MTPPETSELQPERKGVIRSSALFGAWWEIPHPGTLEKVKCATFNEAMDKWFEGFNIPVLVVDGVREDFSKSCDRVTHYYAAPNIGSQRTRPAVSENQNAEAPTAEPRPGSL